MKKVAVLFCILVSCLLTIRAQSFPKVKLSFYLDATQSMESNGLWESSKDKLIQAIKNIEDARTEITICVFADYCVRSTGKALNTDWRFDKITSSDKNRLIDFVKALKSPTESIPSGCSMTLTNLARPWSDFVTKSQCSNNNDVINAMILITDGGHESKYFPNSNFPELVSSWHNSTNQNTFGWVVELKDDVRDSEKYSKQHMDALIESQASLGRLKRTKKHDFNFKFLAINQHPDTINIREIKSFNIKVLANTYRAKEYIKDIQFTCSNAGISVEDIKVLNDSTLKLTLNGFNPNSVITPIEIEGHLPIEIEKNELVTLLKKYSKFRIICKNEFSRVLSITSENKKKEHEIFYDDKEVFEDIEYYKSWVIFGNTVSNDSIVPVKVRLRFKLNPDALDRNSIARLVFVDKNNKPFDNKSIRITDINGNIIDSVLVQEESFIGDYIIAFDPKLYKEGTISGYLRLVDNESLDSACGQKLDDGSSYNIMQWEVDIDTHWNPLFVKFLWILFALLCLLILFLYIIWHHRTFSLRFPTEGRAVFAPIGNAQNIQILGCNFKEQQIVAPGGSDTILTELLNPFYIKEIVVINPNCNNPFIPQERGWWDKLWNGDSIYINGVFANYPINHIVIKPSGTITKEDISLTVNLQSENTTSINSQSITLPIHTITPTNPVTPNVIIQKTNTSVCVFGNSPLHAVHRIFLHQVINFSINIFNH